MSKKQIVVITKNGKVFRDILKDYSEKELAIKILSFKIEREDEVVAMQIVEF